MANLHVNCPFCKTPVATADILRPDVQCATCGKVFRLPPPPTVNVEYGWYFIGEKKQQAGPVSREQLQERATNGLLKPADMIRQEGNKKWQEAGSVSGLFPAPARSFSRKKKLALLAGSAAAVLLAALLFIVQLTSRSRVREPAPVSPQVALKTETPSKPRDIGESAPKITSTAEKSPPPARPEKTAVPEPAMVTTGFVPRTIQATPAAAIVMKQALRRYLFDRTGKSAAGLSQPDTTPWIWCSEQYLNEKNFRALYGLLDEHLRVADNKYLESPDKDTRQEGLGMAVVACRCATFQLKDKWLSIQICEAYIRPRLEDADEIHWNYMGKQHILELMGDAYAGARNAEKFIEILELLIENAHNRNTADGARVRLAQMLDHVNRHEEAIQVLKDIDAHAGVEGAKRWIPDLEKKLQAKKKENHQ